MLIKKMVDKAGAYQKGREILTKSVTAVQKGDLAELKILLAEDTKERLEEISEGKDRKLSHFAAISGHIEVLEWILNNGGGPFDLDNDGNSIASLAVYNEHMHMLQYILSNYPSLLTQHNKKSMSLLHIAAESCNYPIVEYLLSLNLDINEISENGTPLELAVMWKKVDMAKHLLEKGADPNGSRGKFFPPPIVMAASMNNKEAVELLINSAADLEITAEDGVTALEVACEFDFEFLDLLIRKSGKVTGRALAAAFKNKKFQVLDRLLNIIPVEFTEVNTGINELAEEMKTKGNEEFNKKSFEAAIEFYTKAIQIQPSSVYYSNRSQAYNMIGDYHNAIEDARKSRGIDSDNVKAYLREGHALSSLGNHLHAAGCFWNAAKRDKNPTISDLFLSTLSLII